MTPDLRSIARSNAALWAETYLRNEQGQAFQLADHVYQLEPLTIDTPVITVEKAAQLGFTLLFMVKAAHAMICGRVPAGIIYLFPTREKVTEYSETRWKPWLLNNADYLARYIKSTNNVHNKRVGRANLMFRGAKETQTIAGVAKETVALRSDPADGVVFDELDLMPVSSHEKAMDRCLHSELRWDWALSNPTVPRFGIDARFEQGDQRYWMIRCPGCNSWWSEWIEVPQIMRREADGSVHLACLKCGKPLDPNQGQWVPKHPSRSKDHVSYRISQLARPQKDYRHLLDAWEAPPDGNFADVMRYKFGRAYVDAALELTTADVLLCCTHEVMWSRGLGPTAIGVDVGPQYLHVVIGRRLGPDVFQITALMLAESWAQLANVFRTFACEVASIDNEPEVHKAREFQQEMRSSEVWLSDYVHTVRGYQYDHTSGVVRVNRNEILDETHAKITTTGKLRLPASNRMVEMFAEQCANSYKVVEKRPTGDLAVKYLERGPDHFRHAFANFLLAAHRQTPTLVSGKHDTTSASGFDLFD